MSEEEKKKLIQTIEIKKENIIEEKKNEIDYNKRERGRNVQKESQRELRANAAEERIQKEKILTTPLRQNSSNPQQSHKTPSKEGTLEPLERRKQKGMSSNKKLNTNILNTNKQILKDSTKDSTNNTSDEKILTTPPSTPPRQKSSKEERLELLEIRKQQGMPSDKIHIKIDSQNKKWSYTTEKDSNYYINNNDKKIYNKKNKISSKYVYDKDKDNIGPKKGGVYTNISNISNK